MAAQRREDLLSTVQQNKYLVAIDLGGPASENALGRCRLQYSDLIDAIGSDEPATCVVVPQN
jgi:hypothetical protein